MRYHSLNRFEDFEFHDTVFRFQQYLDNRLVVDAKYLNVHKETKQNPYASDMEIAATVITFENFDVESVEVLKPYEMDAEGNLYTNAPDIVYTGEEAKKILIAALKTSCSLNGLDSYRENDRIIVDFDTNSREYIRVLCSCETMKVEWDEYCGLSWYEKIEKKDKEKSFE